MRLLDLLKRPEGKTLEFKRDLSSPEGVLKTLIAFANTAGGTLVIGVEDQSKNVLGVPHVLAVEERLTSLVSDAIHPRLAPDIEVVPWRSLNLLVVHVYPSNTRPHHLQRLGPEIGVFVRVGSSNRRADLQLIEEVKRWNRMDSFDEQAIPDLNSEVIDFRVASEFLAQYRKVTPQGWRTLRVTTDHQGRQVPTIGGLLLFGKNRFERFPDAWIQAGRFAGTDRVRLVDSAEIRSLLPQSAEDALAFARKHLTQETVIEGLRREERWSVPLVAIREALINAIVHADYAQHGAPIRLAFFDDRIEIENPGLLPYGLTIDEIRQGVSKLRNRVIGRVFHELRLIEQWGSGIQRMSAACQSAGLDDPKLEEIGTHFRVTIFTARVGRLEMDETDRRVLALLSDGRARSTAMIAEYAGLSPRATLTRLKSLTQRGVVAEIGTGPHDPKRRYVLAQAGQTR
ncbi:MAG: putative DNA binding domain-containing protein [Bryobacterales bacterium]|nr:putative DNA binding domain-containing protein [Bryobacterales bacterium]